MANDHYVPQFLLRNFEIQGKPGWIYSYKRGFKPKMIGIKSVASEDEYYTLKSSGGLIDRDFPDQFLTRLESETAPIIKKLLTATEIDLSDEECFILIWFIALLFYRTPWARAKLMNMDKALRIHDIKEACRNKELFAKIMQEQRPDMSPEELEQGRLGALDFEENLKLEFVGDDVDDHFLERAFRMAERLIPTLLKKNWALMECSDEQVFVTSDNPIILLPPPKITEGMPFGFLNAPFFFPLSPKRALQLSHFREIGVVNVWGKRMERMVEQMIVYGHKAVFSNIVSDKFQEIFDSIPEGETVKAYAGQRA
jgi:hypothetical protein